MIEILQETTDWGKYKVNNGVYHVNSAGKLVAYQTSQDAEVLVLKTPSNQFSKSRRKFVKIGERPGEHDKDVIVVKSSSGKTYTIQDGNCSCPGYTFRGNCKHVKEHC